MLEGAAGGAHKNLIKDRGSMDTRYEGGSPYDPKTWRYGPPTKYLDPYPGGGPGGVVRYEHPKSTQIGQGDFFNMQDIYAADEKLARERDARGVYTLLDRKYGNTDKLDSYGRPTGRMDYNKARLQWAHDVKNRAAAMSGGETTAWDPSNYRSAYEGATVPPVPVPPASGGGGGNQFDWMNKAFARHRADMSRQNRMAPGSGYYNQFNIPKSKPRQGHHSTKIFRELANIARKQGLPEVAARFGNWKTGYGPAGYR
tara:strand:- start:308 stop:1075 length:768 start_codon:yes stop_codon:yes gene_type:complete